MECQLHFAEVVIRGGGTLNVERMRQDVLRAARVLREKTPELRAVILECSNLATYSRAVSYTHLDVYKRQGVYCISILNVLIDCYWM